MHVPNLTEDEIAGLIGYAREKFAQSATCFPQRCGNP